MTGERLVAYASWLGLACACALGPGCDEDNARRLSPRREALETIVEQVALPQLAELNARADALAGATRALCQAPDASALLQARDAWRAARESYKRLDALSFGPQMLSPYRLGPKLDFWPARPSAVEQLLQGDVALDGGDAGAAVTLGAATRGFPALELLLFGHPHQALQAEAFEPPAQDDAQDAPAAQRSAERRCRLAVLIADTLADDTRELERAWRQDFGQELTLREGPNARFENINEAFAELVNALAFTVEVLRDDKLAEPLGDGEPDLSKLESRFAGRARDDALDTLFGLRAVYYGTRRDPERGAAATMNAGGVSAVLRARSQRFDARFEATMTDAEDALAQLDPSLEDALEHHPERLEDARDALTKLLVLLQVDLTQALSVTVTFGGGDGD